jgi:hypothetical protein
VFVPVAEGADAMPDAGWLTALLEEGKPVRDRATELGRKAAGAVVEGQELAWGHGRGCAHAQYSRIVY